jgi:hypothetical protein
MDLKMPDGWCPLGRPRRKWEEIIKMDVTDVGSSDMGWIHLTIRTIRTVL